MDEVVEYVAIVLDLSLPLLLVPLPLRPRLLRSLRLYDLNLHTEGGVGHEGPREQVGTMKSPSRGYVGVVGLRRVWKSPRERRSLRRRGRKEGDRKWGKRVGDGLYRDLSRKEKSNCVN